MKQIYYLTKNKSKFEEAKKILENSNIQLLQGDVEVVEPKELEQEKVVISKAEQAFEKLKHPVIADDTGIYFEEYQKFPGTFTSYAFKSLGFPGILRLIEKAKNKNAHFCTMLCYKDDKEMKVFKGIWKGELIVDKGKTFNPDWQYNGIFVPQEFDKPLSEIPLEERAKYSHRKKAFDELVNYFGGK